MKEYIIHLEPQSSYEISLHSDTIFGAICWGIRTLFGETRLVQILDEFADSPPFLISSTFPYKKDEDTFKYFLPMPLLKPLSIQDLEAQISKDKKKVKELYHSAKYERVVISNKYKEFRKIKFIGISNFSRIINEPKESELFTDYLSNLLSEPRFYVVGSAQKNSLDRLTKSTTGSGNTFYVPEIAYREKFGVYFLLQCQSIDDYLRPVLKLLEDSGIGPNAKTGKNWFKVLISEGPLLTRNITQEGSSFITLSRYLKNEPICSIGSYYKITNVRSKVESRFEFAGNDVWKNRVSYFTAGSMIMPEKIKAYYGRLAPVKIINGKTIYQYGYAYPVWVNCGGKHEV
ncbi:MAG: type III-A CRISPR-associated RAMP protein Csm4 [Deltaproteobacteria bacterium]|nr:type III-A CRISPR-associated RAMP protein Csm4 [Deltaproteobacteria bacterium]